MASRRMTRSPASPPPSALPAPSPPRSERRRVERLSLIPRAVLISLRRSCSIARRRSDNCHLDHVAHAARFPRKPTDRHHHAQLPTIIITLFQPSPTSPTAAHLTPPTAKLLNRGCSKLHQGVAINFVKKEDIRILRDIEQYYST
ncbi:hypothetical protein GUJ93_ZPchr0014g47583 [Zizania palustris]|uniref:Uncharacterized protein n=1 Tax=Zizania palustris TaxID=103762 RepID=A0A8J5W5T0_ZIZPA|nr:hypothetical protein GUJ93_ZPchr0195g22926 [Zizania palustris]KAG8082548.1 hypothetical protein GUJ93_ZPchr0014g47583 [Zizania palustris]